MIHTGKHVADMDMVTSLRERAAATIAALGGAIPARNGQHRGETA